MKSNSSSLTRRKMATLGMAGGATLILGGMNGCTKIEQVIPVEVEEMPDGRSRIKNINMPVYEGVTRLRFISGTKGWILAKTDKGDGQFKVGPSLWLDGEDMPDKPSEIVDESVVSTKLPTKDKKLHVYFVMIPRGRPDGGCGGGGEVYER